MSLAPIRRTLHHQVVELLRTGIEQGRWVNELPSEAKLCQEFQVSRMTMRNALAQLAAEDWIELGGRGKFHRIKRAIQGRRTATARTIRILNPYPFSAWDTSNYLLFKSLTETVQNAGYRVEVEHHRGVYESFQASKLERLDALPDTAAWVLTYSTEAIQRWFAGSGRPTVVTGRTYGNVQLPSIYPDTEATGRHAAGKLHAYGHREMVYLIENLTSLGDRMSAEAFVAEAGRLGAKARMVAFDDNPESMGKVAMDLLTTRPRPTGFAVGSAGFGISLLCRLLAAGIRVPAEAGVMVMWESQDLDSTFPTIARYRTDGKLMGRRIGKTVLDLIRHGPGQVRSIAIMPEYVPGGSVGPLSP